MTVRLKVSWVTLTLLLLTRYGFDIAYFKPDAVSLKVYTRCEMAIEVQNDSLRTQD